MISILIYLILGFAMIQWIVVLVNLVFKARLPQLKTIETPLISVLIPARNEQHNIGNILQDLINQDYQNIEIIVCNDHSEDETQKVIESFMNLDKRVQVFDSQPLPEGWLGKNWACHQLSQKAKGTYFLFVDADVRMNPDLVSTTLQYHKNQKVGLLTIFPTQKMDSLGEYLTVPLMHYILLTLLPLILVRKSHYSSLSAANGQFMFFDAAKYKQIDPHFLVRNNKVEDIVIAGIFKKHHIPVACITGIEAIKCRMYQNLNEGIQGFSKNMVTFFGNSYLLALLFWSFTTLPLFFIPFTGTILENILFFLLYFTTKIMVSIVAKQNIFKNILLFIPQHVIMLIIIIQSLLYSKNRKQIWKGRFIS
ncbi:MAG: glycosyl transferase family 2 [Bacteroidetes bacterium]|nr:glycosyl transferase family 2 [Bacteroidota bacterium]